jgi:hypothetical protein
VRQLRRKCLTVSQGNKMAEPDACDLGYGPVEKVRERGKR